MVGKILMAISDYSIHVLQLFLSGGNTQLKSVQDAG